MFHGQINQDKWVLEKWLQQGNSIGDKGYFVDVGAFDGVQFSNSLLFEKLDWNGVCIEASAASAEKCKQNRKCDVVQAIVTGKEGGQELFVRNEIEPMLSHVTRSHSQGYSNATRSLTGILKDVNAPRKIDYLSIDVEGVDFEVLQGLDMQQYDVGLITIEHNGQDQASQIANWLWANNYMIRMVEWDFFAVKDTVRVLR